MTKENQSNLIEYIILFAAFFNSVLAIINHNFVIINASYVILCELIIVAASTVIIWNNYKKSMLPWIYFSLFFFVLFLVFTLINGSFDTKTFRDMLLISIFGLLGISYHGNIIKLITIAVSVLMAFTLLEGFFTEIFVNIFNPYKYYFYTRNIGEIDNALSINTGIFKNATGFEGRASFSLFDTHRLSSLFLEQTSLASFNVFIAIFTSCFWKKLSKFQKIFFPICIFLWIGFTDSRFALGMIFLIIIGHFIYPIIPRYFNLSYMPLVIILSAIIFHDHTIVQMHDTISGRIGWTIYILSEMDIMSLLGLSIAPHTQDSGYSHIIYSYSIFGVLVFWLFTSLILPQNNNTQKIYAHNISIVIAISLLFGSVIFSIKSAAFIWFTVGHLYNFTIYKKYNVNLK